MKRTDYKTWLIELVENNKHSYVKKLRAKANKHILEWIDALVPLLAKNKFYSLQTKLYWIFNDIKDFPLCPNCNKVKLTMHNVKSLYVGYGTLTCSKKCRYELMQKHSKETCIKRYGVAFTFQTEQLKKKSQKTCIENMESHMHLDHLKLLQNQKQHAKQDMVLSHIHKQMSMLLRQKQQT